MMDEKDTTGEKDMEAKEAEPVFTMKEWVEKCAYAILPTEEGNPYIITHPGMVPSQLMYAALSQELAMLQAALTAQMVLDAMQEARKQMDIQRQLANPNGAPIPINRKR